MSVWISKKLWHFAGSAVLVLLLARAPAQAQSDAESAIAGLIWPIPTTIYTAKRVITMDAKNSSATAVAVHGERIVAVGSLASVKQALGSTEYSIDASFDGRIVMPGLIHQYLHPILGALPLAMPVIATESWVLPGKIWPAAASHKEYMSALWLEERGMQDPNETLFTWGYHQFFHGMVRRQELDAISASRPIVVWHRSCHDIVLKARRRDGSHWSG